MRPAEREHIGSEVDHAMTGTIACERDLAETLREQAGRFVRERAAGVQAAHVALTGRQTARGVADDALDVGR